MFCKNCGANIKDGVKFCPKCGFSFYQNSNTPEKAEAFVTKNGYDPFTETDKSASAPVQPTVEPAYSPEQPVNQPVSPVAYASEPKVATQPPMSAVTYNNASKAVTYAVGTPEIAPPKKKKIKAKIILPIISIILVIAIAAGSLIFVKDKERYYKSREIITRYNDGEPATTETRFREDGQIEYWYDDLENLEISMEYDKNSKLSKIKCNEINNQTGTSFCLSVEYEKDGRNYIGTAQCETELYGEMSEISLDITYNSKGEMIDSAIKIDDELIYSLEVDGRTKTEITDGYKIVTNYNKNGNVNYEEHYREHENDLKLWTSYENTYDGKKCIKSETKLYSTFNEEEFTTYISKYEIEKNRLVGVKQYQNGELIYTTETDKNTADKLKLSYYQIEDGKKEYDGYSVSSFERNKLTKSVMYDKDDETIYECLYKNEKLVEQTNYNNGEISSQYKYEYEKKSLINYLFG